MTNKSLWILFGLAVLISATLPTAESREKCTNGLPRELYTERSVLILHNLTFTVHPRYPGGQPYKEARATIQFRGLQEFYRPYIQCFEPSNFPVPETPGVQFFRNITAEEMDCEYFTHTFVVSGVTLNTTAIKMMHPSFPNFAAYINFTTSDGNVSRQLGYSSIQDEYYTANYVKDVFKYSLGVENWPWEDDSGGSYLNLFWSVPELSLPSAAAFGSGREGKVGVLWARTLDGRVRFEQTVEQSFMLDDHIFVRSNASDVLIPSFPLPVPWHPEIVRVSMALCNGSDPPGFHWSRFISDPTLSMLFTPPLDPLSAPLDEHKKGVVVAAIVVPVVLALAFLSLLAAFHFKPELKNYFRPYRKRNEPSPSQLK